MVWQYQCPVDGCEFSASDNEEPKVVESAQQHASDAHGATPTREEVEEYVVGPG